MKVTIKQIKLIYKTKKKPLIQVACVKNYRENYREKLYFESCYSLRFYA